VEENNFGIRKRLLEYDDVMNKQRTVIYEKRRHALMGERIGMDISNMIWDRCINLIEKSADYASCSDAFIEIMAMEAPFTESEYFNMKREDLYEKAFEAAMAGFKRRTDRLAEIAMPVIKQVYEQQAHTYENILIPITDGRLVYNIRTNLQKAYETESKEVVKDFEKAILLHNIDDAWKENLRALDELKHAVRNASYEQKDPLLIFKLESVKLFDAMVDKINNATVATLMRAQIPVQAPQEVREAAPEPETPKQQYTTSHEGTDLQDQGMKEAAARDTREQQQRQPIVKDQLPGRNDPCPCGSGKKFKNCHGQGL
jgi:preprotein translocase subunit SecA